MTRWLTGLALCVTLALPAKAFEAGPCTDGAMWWTEGQLAGYGPCESPGEGFLVLSCADGEITMEIDMPLGVATGEIRGITLTVDSTEFALDAEGTLYPRSGTIGAGNVQLSEAAVTTLANGSRAQLGVAGEIREAHLTGSRAALATLQRSCRG